MTRPTLARTLLALALLAASALPVLAAPPDWPRLGLYGRIRGTGYPYISGGDASGPFDSAVLDQVARYDEVILNASPICEYRPQLLSELRMRNPDISLICYVISAGIWDGVAGPDSLINYPSRYRRLVRDLDGYLYNRTGAPYSLCNVNLAKKDAFGRYVMAEALVDLWVDVIVTPGIWDGMFLDSYCDGILWSETPSERIDYQRAGYASLAAFDAGWKAGTEAMAARLRQRAGPDFLLIGNCGQGSKYSTFNGWMREDFPRQNGGTWFTNLFNTSGGYLNDDVNFRSPPHNYLFAAADLLTQPYHPSSCQEVRFVLASAALGEGFGVYGAADLDPATGYHSWWYDEYAVNLATGQSSSSLAHTGWLGQPIGPQYQMIWVGTQPDASSNPDFESDVTSGWLFGTNGISATMSRDASTAGNGSASAHLFLPLRAPVDYLVNFSTVGRIGLTAGQQYAATFWTKASAPCTLTAVVSPYTPGGPPPAVGKVAVGTTWKRHQLILIPSASGTSSLQFYLGHSATHLWLDDVHFQRGATTLYRRDFQNGIVLVNPTSATLSVPLEREFRRIRGVADPVRNDGALVNSVTLPSNDAVFLIGSDMIPPAGVTDLRPVPDIPQP